MATTTVVNLRDLTSLDGIVYVSRRRCLPTGQLLDNNALRNPHAVDEPCRARGCHGVIHTRVEAIAAYCQRLLAHPELLDLVPELRGRTLACWCAPQACHAHVLAVLAELDPLEIRPILRRLAVDPTAVLPTGV